MKPVLLLFVLAILLSACNELKSGKIVDKDYEPGYYYTSYQQIGKTYIPMQHWQPPTYHIQVQGYNKKGKLITEWWSISSGNYDRYQIGQTIKDTTSNW